MAGASLPWSMMVSFTLVVSSSACSDWLYLTCSSTTLPTDSVSLAVSSSSPSLSAALIFAFPLPDLLQACDPLKWPVFLHSWQVAVRALHLPSPWVGLVHVVHLLDLFLPVPPDLPSARTCSSKAAIRVCGASFSGLVLNLSATLTACSLAMPSLITSVSAGSSAMTFLRSFLSSIWNSMASRAAMDLS